MRRIVDTSDPVNWSHPLNRGLVSWWLALPDQQRGVMWRDLCGRNHGTLSNMDPATDWRGSRGRPGGWGSLDFDGTNDTIATATISLAGNYSVGGWFYDRSITSTRVLIGGNGTTDFSLLWDSTYVYHKPNNSTCFTEHGLTLALNTWIHFFVTRSGTTVTWYINGSSVGSSTASGTHTIDHLGSYGDGSARYLGSMDDIRVYSRSLSATSISSLYSVSRQGYPGLLNRLPARRPSVVEASPGGLSIPIAAYHYNHHLGSMA